MQMIERPWGVAAQPAALHIDDVDSDNPANPPYRGHGSHTGEASAEDLAPGHVVVSASVILGLAITRD